MNTKLVKRIYLDHHATTPVEPRVMDTMLPFFMETFGNASSTTHGWGRDAASAVERAREQVARLVGAQPLEIVFTSGATESVNLALKGLADQYGESRRHIVTAVCEHPAVLDCCAFLEKEGFEITYLEINQGGHLDYTALEGALRKDTLAVSLMYGNNEIGTLHDMARIGALTRKHGVFFHCDASQAAGKEPIDVTAMEIDLLSLSAHKLYGPKGVGALYIRRKQPRVRLVAQMHGGGHERGYRSGTLNVPLIVGMGAACAIAGDEMDAQRQHLRNLRERFLDQLAMVEPRINGDMSRRLVGNLNLRFEGVAAADILTALPEVALSTTSACSQAAKSPSRTLKALGLSGTEMSESLRIGFGRGNTREEIDYVGRILASAVSALRVAGKQGNVECQI